MEKNNEQVHPAIDSRPYRHKKPILDFLCPLCGIERQFSKSYKLTNKNYLQMSILSVTLLLFFFPLMGIKGLIFIPMNVALFELWARVSFRKDIPCPHCGFDASWYKKDVPKAPQLVHEFWEKRESSKTDTSEEIEEAGPDE